MNLTGHTVIYGGSFDPPHMSHQISCLYLSEALGAQEIWLIPSYVHPFGKVLANFTERFAMCELLAAPFGARVKVLAVEKQLAGVGRTYDTLQYLHQAYPQRRFALAIGADIVGDTPRWYRWPDIVAMLPVVVIGRVGHAVPEDNALWQTPVQMPPIASSNLRERVLQGGNLSGLVPQAVAEFVQVKKLYQAVPSTQDQNLAQSSS